VNDVRTKLAQVDYNAVAQQAHLTQAAMGPSVELASGLSGRQGNVASYFDLKGGCRADYFMR
jgi:hypothetical protein